ncbi:MAG: PadR family transcriptional regulator [Actinomycetota bacterium]|nr:PadR family transcriptional regulator [Actinomycetota bacterium]
MALRATQTSYAVLGLLALRSWTGYELAQQASRSLGWFFPRAERAVYLEVKRLVQMGWAAAEQSTTGRRPSTTYRVTTSGRRALADWLQQPSPPTQIESEAAMKVFFADQETLDATRATVDGIRHEAAQAIQHLSTMTEETLNNRAPFPDRVPTNILSMKLVTDVHHALLHWATWAEKALVVLETGDTAAINAQATKTLNTITNRSRW